VPARCTARTRHIYLAAHLQHFRPAIALQLRRHTLYLAQIGSDILASRAITTGRTLHECTLHIAQADSQPIELWFRRKSQLLPVELFPYTPYEVMYFLGTESIRQRQHRHGMPDFSELSGRRCAHASRRRLRSRELRMRRLQRLQLAHQDIELGVGDLRLVQRVVQPVVVFDLLAQLLDTLLRRHAHGYCPVPVLSSVSDRRSSPSFAESR
jgi:hypothetical protein